MPLIEEGQRSRVGRNRFWLRELANFGSQHRFPACMVPIQRTGTVLPHGTGSADKRDPTCCRAGGIGRTSPTACTSWSARTHRAPRTCWAGWGSQPRRHSTTHTARQVSAQEAGSRKKRDNRHRNGPGVQSRRPAGVTELACFPRFSGTCTSSFSRLTSSVSRLFQGRGASRCRRRATARRTHVVAKMQHLEHPTANREPFGASKPSQQQHARRPSSRPPSAARGGHWRH